MDTAKSVDCVLSLLSDMKHTLLFSEVLRFTSRKAHFIRKSPFVLGLTVIRNEFKLTTVSRQFWCARITNAKATARFRKERAVDPYSAIYRKKK